MVMVMVATVVKGERVNCFKYIIAGTAAQHASYVTWREREILGANVESDKMSSRRQEISFAHLMS